MAEPLRVVKAMPLTNGPVPALVTPLRAMSIEDIYAYVVPEREWTVEGTIPTVSFSMMNGREKTGKTLWLVDLCCSVALGEEFMGKPTKQMPVLMLCSEDFIEETLSRIRNRLDGRKPELYLIPPRGVYEGEPELRFEDDFIMERLRSLIVERNIGLLGLDPFRELHDRGENEADDMGPLLRAPRELTHALKIATVLVHHQGRSGSYRGSTAIGGAVDQILTFKRKDQTETDLAWLEVAAEGQLRIEGRYGPRQILEVILAEGNRWLIKGSDGAPVKPVNTRALLTDLLKGGPLELTAQEIADGIGGNLKTVKNTITLMKREVDCNLFTVPSENPNDPDRYRWMTLDEAFYGRGIFDDE